MTFGKFPQRLFVYLAVTTAALAQTGSVLFRLPGAGSGQNHLVAYSPTASNLATLLDTAGPTNASQVIPVPHNGQFYVVGDGAVQLLNVGQSTFQAVNGVVGNVARARLSPDGRYLMVMGENFYVVNTLNNTLVAANVGTTGHTVVDVAFSVDSKMMYMLRSLLGEYSLVSVNLSNLIAGTGETIPLAGLSLTMSPNGALYVSAQDAIGEYNPDTLQRTATIPVTGRPGPLRFTPDGTRAYFANLTPEFGGRSVQSFRTAQRDITGWPSTNIGQNVPRFDDVLVASADQVYALDRTNTTLWQIYGTPLNGQLAAFPNTTATQVYSAAISSEVPLARYLYLLGSTNGQLGLRRIALADATAAGERSVIGSDGILNFATVPSQLGAVYLTKFGDNQALPVTGGTVRIAGRLADNNGQPVYNHPVIFSTGNSSVTISSKNATTGSDGLVQTFVSVPGIPGTYTVSIIAASIAESFQIRVLETNPGNGGGGGGGGGGETGEGSIKILRGDGMLIGTNQIGNPDWAPLTAELRDQDGNLAVGVPVEFQMVSGPGGVASYLNVSDDQGLAKATFFPGQIPIGTSFDTAIVRAHSAYGDVDFKVIVFRVNQTTGVPAIQIDTPSTFQVTGTRGEVVPNAFKAFIRTRDTVQGVPNVSLRAASGNNFLVDGPGVCVNDTHSDINGIATCDMKISCSADDLAPIQMVVGEAVISTGAILARSAGGRKLAVVQGNNQSGNAGGVLNRLVAKVTDSCDSPASGQDVVWTVSQGSATLTQVVSRSGSDGLVSAGVTLGNTAGQVTIRVSIANASPVDFTVTTNVVINSVTLISGGGQAAGPGAAFANPVVFEVRDNNGAAVGSGVTVNFSADNGASLGSTSASTNAQGRVQTTVTAGNSTGNITVTASVAGKTGTAQLQVRPPTLPLDSNSFTNAASRAAGLVPCGLITLVGNGLSPTPGSFFSGLSAFGPLPYTLGGVSIRINGVPAPIQAVANQNGVQSVNFQAPCETQPGVATAVVSVNGTDTTVSNIPVFVAQPGIFTYAGPDNKTYGAVIRIKDGSYITPSNPAPTGEEYYLILTGLGQTNPATVTNAAGLDQAVAATVAVGTTNAGYPSQTARYLTGNTGVYYIRFTIPSQGVASGTILRDVPLLTFAVVNGQAVFGNATLMPAIRQQ